MLPVELNGKIVKNKNYIIWKISLVKSALNDGDWICVF